MRGFAVILAASMMGLAVAPVSAQSADDMNLQIHGYAAQGFLYTTHNSIFYANSSNGSPAWTEAVANVTTQPADGLRVGLQVRYQLLGSTGNDLTLDWAAADYKFSDRLGIRFGKVKTPWGLFNETQDIDPSYMWALLPQSVYDITTRDSDLAHLGGLAYGTLDASRAGRLDYRVWGGEQVISTTDGQFDDLNDAGNGPLHPLEFATLGGALHWRTPIRGLMLGASDGKANQASVELHGGSESFAPWNNLSWFGQFEKNKVMLAAEWNRQASPGTLSLAGQPVSSVSTDARGWYVMGTCKLSARLSAGVYNSQFFDHDAPLSTDRFTKDWTVSARYDISSAVYLKADEHFIDGTSLSLDSLLNPASTPRYDLTALRIGVVF
jgi:hypothetical protein